MEKIIKNFPKQFLYEPEIENGKVSADFERVIVAGMGGSALSAGILQMLKPELETIIHRDYGLPRLPEETLQKCLIVANSHSGNTEEALDAFRTALAKNLKLAAVSAGGKLLEEAKNTGAPFIKIPAADIQPRFALGYNIRALMKIIGDDELLKETKKLAGSLKPGSLEKDGEKLSQNLRNKIPLLYASASNSPLAYIWKVKFNETAKIPAFFNVFPELSHNEMAGFDLREKTKNLSEKFYCLFLEDPQDPERIKKGMEITRKILSGKGLESEVVWLESSTPAQKIFSSLILADWTSYYLAKFYGVDPKEVPLVEEFKGLLKKQ